MMKTETPKYKRWALQGAGLSLLLLFSTALYQNFASRHSQIKSQDSQKNHPDSSRALLYQWSYASNASYHGSSGADISVLCKAMGQWSFGQGSSLLTIESFRCNDQELASNRLYQFDPETFLALDPRILSAASPINALALALSRELAMGRPTVHAGEWSYAEPRLETSINRGVKAEATGKKLQWTKEYNGKIPSRPEISHHLKAESSGVSAPGISPFLALDELHMKEIETIEIGGKAISESTVGIEIRRSPLHGSVAFTDAEALPLAVKKDPEIERRQILSEWNTFLQHPPSSKASADPLYVRLKLAFRNDPSLVNEFRHTLERYSPDSEEFKLLLGALAYAGTEEATNALIESARAKGNDLAWQTAIAPVLGLSPKPTPASWDYLESIRKNSDDQDLRKGAELALAGQIKQGMQSDESEAFTKEVLSRDASGPELYSMLDVIGNAAIETETARLTEWAKRDDPKLRSAVAESMRLMKSLESEQLLLQLLGDADIEVRRTAAQAFQTRVVSAQALPELLAALKTSRDELLQLTLLETLYRSETLLPTLKEKLRDGRQALNLSSAVKDRWIEIEDALGRS